MDWAAVSLGVHFAGSRRSFLQASHSPLPPVDDYSDLVFARCRFGQTMRPFRRSGLVLRPHRSGQMSEPGPRRYHSGPLPHRYSRRKLVLALHCPGPLPGRHYPRQVRLGPPRSGHMFRPNPRRCSSGPLPGPDQSGRRSFHKTLRPILMQTGTRGCESNAAWIQTFFECKAIRCAFLNLLTGGFFVSCWWRKSWQPHACSIARFW